LPPTQTPTSSAPSPAPSVPPSTSKPTVDTDAPTIPAPSSTPTLVPSPAPSPEPSPVPSPLPTPGPSPLPTPVPSSAPSLVPSPQPSGLPSPVPTTPAPSAWGFGIGDIGQCGFASIYGEVQSSYEDDPTNDPRERADAQCERAIAMCLRCYACCDHLTRTIYQSQELQSSFDCTRYRAQQGHTCSFDPTSSDTFNTEVCACADRSYAVCMATCGEGSNSTYSGWAEEACAQCRDNTELLERH